MKSTEEILSLYRARQKRLQPDFAAMDLFDRFIAGKLPVPLAELDSTESSAIANLAAQGLHQLAQRIGSVLPMPDWPALRPGIQTSENRATKRRKASLGWWEHSDMQGVLTLRAEYLLAHAAAPVLVLPNPVTKIPEWRALDPRTVFPAPVANSLQVVPDDVIIAYRQSWGFMVRTYGEARLATLRRPVDTRPDHQVLFIQYVDAEQITTLVGVIDEHSTYGTMEGASALPLDDMPNRAQTPLVFVPTLYGVGGQRGMFDGTIGIHQMRAKLLALAYITASKGAMPDTWLEPLNDNSVPEYTSVPNHRTGEPGVVTQGRIHNIDINPAFGSTQMLATLERELRLQGGIPASFGGEAPSTVQTGRMASSLLGAAVDYPIQQAQLKFERSLELENKAAAAIITKWTPGAQSFYVKAKSGRGQVDYDDTDFENDNCIVRYPLAGSDLNNELLRTQQKVASDIWSRHTARIMDPETLDPELERDRVTYEAIERGILAEFMQPAQPGVPGGLTIIDKARVGQLVIANKLELADAIIQVQKEAQARQAAQAAAQPAPTDPNAQPGITTQPPSVSPTEPGLANLAHTFRAIGAQVHPAAPGAAITTPGPG